MPSSFIPPLTESLISEEFALRGVLSLFLSLTRRNSALFAQFFASFASFFASPAFILRFSTRRQQRIAALLYCFLQFQPLDPESSTVSTILQAVGNRLADVDDSVKPAVIGIAKRIATIVSPEGRFEWPETKLEALDELVDGIRKEMEGGKGETLNEGEALNESKQANEKSNEIESLNESKQTNEKSNEIESLNESQKPDKNTVESQKPDQNPIESHETKENEPSDRLLHHKERETEADRYVDPEELIDIFSEENFLNAFNEDENDFNDDEDSFIPYDLTEIQDVSTKTYFFIDEALGDLSSENHATSLHAWNEFHRLCCDLNQKLSEEETAKIMRVVLEMNGIVGHASFWNEWREAFQSLIFRKCRVAMEELYRFIRKNGRSNLTINKCVVILQGVYQACLQLYHGALQFETNDSSFEEQLNVQLSKEDGFDELRVANTKYRPSFYRKKLQQQQQQQQKEQQQKSHSNNSSTQTNQFTENSQFVIRTLVSWMIRFPPREDSTISYHFLTLSLVFSLPILTAVFDEESADLRTLVLRYRYHSAILVRRSVLQFYYSASRYFDSSNSLQILDRSSVVEWLSSVLVNDPDDTCRSVARVILSEMQSCFVY